jgi:perosamine synthetase
VLGVTHDTWHRRAHDGGRWQYDVRELGYKAAMPDLAAAIGLVQLAKVARLNARRRALAARYVAAFADLAWLATPRVAPGAVSAWYTFPIRLRARAALARHLAARGIATGVHYRPLHHHALYRDRRAAVPVADALWRRLLLLPLHPTLNRREQARVIAAVRSFAGGLSHARRRVGALAVPPALAGGGAERALRRGVRCAGRAGRVAA